MNGIEDNLFTRNWQEAARSSPTPTAVVCISAHWLTRGDTRVTAMEAPPTIHDFGGFPEELYGINYPAPGDPAKARDIGNLVSGTTIHPDHEWGLDHGTWTVVRHMYPEADIPVLQISIDYSRQGDFHHMIGRELAALRRKGVLLIGSGNIVHNLRMVDFSKLSTPGYGYDWALETDALIRSKISRGEHQSLIHYEKLGAGGRLSIPTPDHYWPLLYILGARMPGEEPAFFNQYAVGGAVTMTSLRFG